MVRLSPRGRGKGVFSGSYPWSCTASSTNSVANPFDQPEGGRGVALARAAELRTLSGTVLHIPGHNQA
jgi:hypothetical protein